MRYLIVFLFAIILNACFLIKETHAQDKHRFEMFFYDPDSILIIVNMKSINNFIMRNELLLVDTLSLRYNVDFLENENRILYEKISLKDSMIEYYAKLDSLNKQKILGNEQIISNLEKIVNEKEVIIKELDKKNKNIFSFLANNKLYSIIMFLGGLIIGVAL